ncbi:flagellar biosynthesis protein FlhF [Cytobacillus firmus]|uniref:flagellar biosynthesis protein FlhF n=1 Tax=Cytobacillus firmus TaxID=1399 RepID=UPI00077C68A1|nr:flagellar biosynthesis protein FlhF [Cytobacillus firmus]MBG9542106.1 flagellar biosynthesis regulator FlhF [Cytobacillus firmus]MBG9548124.1 flagellar biosynthesis regulator FlhF [Cytobacillus firmus]MBG9551580.1 flagellar biosynthesis regulator FlhF [Cytobacillus firmus]MBG9556607.1 flagellar biosynthesis regulator FlhF [Cytobacillus firmus]MBG9575998.1 flagellar biosynthesis regulator FlhF [Cytobacillus firmus]
MKVKKFMAASMPDAMKQIRAELGKDAVILNSRVVYTGGVLGFFKKRNIEVMAAADSNQEIEQKPAVKPAAIPAASNHFKGNTEDSQFPGSRTSDELIREISSLKQMMSSLAGGKQISTVYPEAIRKVMQLLNEQEIDNSIQDQVLQVLLEKWYLGGAKAKAAEVEAWLQEELIKQIEDIPFSGISFTKKYINVAGPTGVGKTTTLAKMAAECVIKHKKKAAFITADTYRIAAIDQLKTYAGILDIPLEVCYTIDDFRQAAEKLKEYDLVLIDTAGRNFRNRQYVEDLKNVIDFEKDMETFLVLSLTAKQKDMEDIYNQFSIIDIDKLIFTKADETSTYGAMYNIIHKYKKGTAYITNGQDVPDDILMAGPEDIVKQLMGNKK